MNLNESDAIRFWKKVYKPEELDACWLWFAHCHKKGYGKFNVEGNVELAHRVSWVFAHGQIPGALKVLHSCDTRNCVNPDHLFLGTDLDNMRDMIAKGRERHQKGSEAGRAILVEEQVLEIRTRLKAGERVRRLCEDFGVAYSTIQSIKRNINWTHI